jgi:putative alpha-1,2-mannosidase
LHLLIISENRKYLGFDNKIHTLDKGQDFWYSDMSIWDVHRTEFPWLGLTKPDVLTDIVRSLVQMGEQGGAIPRWPIANGYTGMDTIEFFF